MSSMILSDVLKVLSTHCKKVGIEHKDLYLMLFEEEDINIEQTVKNTFGKRALNQRIFKKIIMDNGFVHLTNIIKSKLLSIIGGHQALYQSLYKLVENDDHLSNTNKKVILASFDPDDSGQLAQFIALCIICGNYNTAHPIKEKAFIPEEYGINLEKYTSDSGSILIEYDLWKASQDNFFLSRSKGQRFSSLNIITQLLPKGFIAEPDFLIKGKTETGTIKTVMELCTETTDHIAIIGGGGIGKTTFLHQLMAEAYAKEESSVSDLKELVPLSYQSGRPIPFFIELNRCPQNIETWYDDSLRKTNFITRYVAQILKNHLSLEYISATTLDLIEKEFQKKPENGKPRYLLLLDGFNEVKSSDGHSIRTCLSNEISVISSYPNVRIITTSRETQAAYYAASFKNIRLIGLEKKDIITYLKRCKMSETKIGLVMACKPLVECLRIPLYICMFCAEDTNSELPETPGEILYSFFHRNSSFYNIRSRATDTRTNPLNAQQTAFILDFVLPYIGWHFEKKDCFSVNETDFEEIIKNSIFVIRSFCSKLTTVPFTDFQYKAICLIKTADSLYEMHFENKQSNDTMLQKIIDCIFSYLGIVYQYQTTDGSFQERNRYAFSHHQFRDYFSAMWDIQLLTLTQCMNERLFFQEYTQKNGVFSCSHYLNSGYWQHHKTEFISQILMEHRNKPLLHPQSQNWYLPKPKTDEQQVLTNVLRFCRNITERDLHYLIQNILSAILEGRKELSGLDLSKQNLCGCNFFNVTCSRKGKSTTLAAHFYGATLEQGNFHPESHQNDVIDYLYHKQNCFSLDDDGLLKCWDILSGKLEYEYQFPDPTGINDFSSSGFLKISPNGEWLAVKIQESRKSGMLIGIQFLHLKEQSQTTSVILPDKRIKAINHFSFTSDSKGILIIADYTIIFCYSLEEKKILYRMNCPDLLKETQLYAESISSPIFAFTTEYDLYDSLGDDSEIYDEEENDEDIDDDDIYHYIPVPCQFCWIKPHTGKQYLLYSFVSMPGSEPTAIYIPHKNSFLYYNYSVQEIEYFNCATQKAYIVLTELTQENQSPPSHIHLHPEHRDECYVMYPDNCYLIDLENLEHSGIIMKYPISGLHKLLSDSEQEGELYFKTAVIPSKNRFIVSNDITTYEWNTEDDTLLPKYNLLYYSCTGLISDTVHNQFILVHQNNGVSVFAGLPAMLKYSYCFEEPDYTISNYSYHDFKQLLALTFSRSDHEKIILLDLTNSEQHAIFSTMYQHETVENICYHPNENHILIATQYQCCEYSLEDNLLYHVLDAADGERIAGAGYSERLIEIAIVQNRKKQEKSVIDRCEYYEKRKRQGKVTYTPKWYYVLPELTEELFPYFIFFHGDFGVQGPVDDSGMQSYWITNGFFLVPSNNDSFSLPQLDTYSLDAKRTHKKRTILPHQFVYFKHTRALEYKYREKPSGFSYTFLDEKSGTAIFMKNSEKLFLHRNFRLCTYKEIEEGFSKNLGSYDGHAYWDYAVPYLDNQIIGCYENYKLLALDADTGEELYDIEYTPGLSIYDCDFRYAKADEILLDELNQNGGIIS